MWKIVFLLLVVSNTLAQKITPNIARWCISNYDDNKLAYQLIVEKDSIIKEQGVLISLDTKVVKTYQLDSINYNKIIINQNKLIENRETIIKDDKKKSLGLKIQNIVLKIGIVILVIIEVAKK